MTDQMVNYDDDVLVRTIEVSTKVPVVRSTVTVRSTAQAAKPDHEWSWQELRDYVVNQIEHFHGSFDRNIYAEIGIFKRFAAQWGSHAPAIARCAFEVHGGFWYGSPITVQRFTKGADPFFAQPLFEALQAAGTV